MRTKFTFLFLLLSLSFTYAQTIRYVRPVASGSGDGSSWANSSSNLQAMINASGVQQVWVAAGTYKPTTGTDRGISFSMKNDVAIYGGFPNTGNPTMTERNWNTNPTILSGDINAVGVETDNSVRIISNINLNSSAILDGFVISDCYNQGFGNGTQGGGMRNVNSSPTVVNCIFRNNRIEGRGSACANVNEPTTGGMSSGTFTNCLFYNNVGGNIFLTEIGFPKLINCTFSNNIYNSVVISANLSNSQNRVTNCIIWDSGSSMLQNTNSASVTLVNNSIVKNGFSGCVNCPSTNGNIDPLFVNAAGNDYSLQACSPAINAGNNAGISGVDLANNPRIYNNGVVDMGAYEYQGTAAPSPTAVSISQTTVCQGTSVNLQATCTIGTVNWYNTSTGGTALGTGSSFSYTAPVGANQTFYASCKSATCETALVATSNTLTVTPTRLYVNASATAGANNGTSWTNAYNDLQAGLSYARANTCVTEIWVAKGTYKPHASTRSVSFNLINGVTIYGGFPNDGSGTLANRNPAANETILSGDIGSVGNTSDNSYHVVANGNGINSTAKLDGFVITGGNADKTTAPSEVLGGGIYNDGRNGASCSPTFINCILRQNSAVAGGGVSNNGDNGTCNPTFVNCILYQNQVYGFGGAFHSKGNVNSVLTNCTFAYNSAMDSGGAICSTRNFGDPNITLKNCILWGNTANTSGTQIYLHFSTLTLSNTTLQSGVNEILNSQSSSTINNNGNILTTDPFFVNANTGDLRLTACSPAINAGDNTGISGVDLANNPRIYNNGVVDMGAYEYQGTAVPSPTAVSISQTTVCQGTSVNLQATCANGTVNWYNSSTGGTALGTGSSFSYIAPVGANQTFYASCKGSCESALVATSNTLTVNTAPTRLYVNATATGTNTGLTWADAFTSLQSALNYSCNGNLTEIWVAKGTYKPHTNDRKVSFAMLPNVKIYGGFPNTGNPTMADRNWTTNPTILSGDLNGNDVVTGSGATLSITGNGENSYHVIFNNNNGLTTTNSLLDGFTIKGGNANGGSIDNNGGGMYNFYASPSLLNVIFWGNNASTNGGGMLNSFSSPSLINVILSSNNAGYQGGGMSNNSSNLSLSNVTLAGNNTPIQGGGMFNSNSSPNLNNATFSSNNAGGGGGMYNVFSSPIIKNTIFWGNKTGGTVISSIFNQEAVGYTTTITNSNIEQATGVYPGIGNINNNPLFVNASNPAGADGVFGTNDDGLMLLACSPAINTGDNTANSTTTDLAGNSRVFNTTIDMGAYETQTTRPSTPTITPPSQLVVCSPTALTLTANCTTGNVVWSDNSTGTSLTLSAVGTYAISAKCVLNACDSDASSTTNLEIKAKPSVPTITPPSQLVVCSPTALTLTANCSSGNVVWSDNSTGTSLTLSAVGTYAISAKCTLNGCDSDQSSTTNLEIKAKPSVPTITPPSQLVVCSPTALTLTANCTTGNVVWSDNSTGTSLTLSAVNTYAISAKCTLNGCDSDQSSVTNLEIKAKPSIPTITPPSQLVVCSPSNLILTANCTSGNVVWSDNSTGTSLTLNSVGTYSISAKCVLNGCESDVSTATNLEIKAKPSVPIITPPTNTVVCSPTSLTLTATCATGNVLWSNNSTGTSLTLNSVGTYSISAKCVLNGCESDPSSTTSLEIKAKPSVPTITPPSQLVVCSPSNLTLTATCASGNVVWSDNSTGKSLTLNSVGTYSISAKCVLNGCESDPSSVTNLEIKAKPSVPTITPPSQLVVCSPSNLTLTANCASGNVLWSDNSTGTSLTLSAVGTYAISAKCTLNGCDSDQSSVTNLEIKAKPSVPTITPPSQLVVCSPSNLTLTASCASGNIVWSDNSTGTSLTLSAVGTYSISAKCTLNSCDSDQSSTTNLEIKAKPSVPTITPPSQLIVCSPSNLTLTANCASGNVIWSDNSTGTSLTLSAVGTYAISAKCVLNGCNSDQSSTTNLEIKAKPTTPTITPQSQLVVCSPSNLTLTASCATGNVVWSDNSTGTSLTLNSVGTYSVSAKCVLNGCDSDPSSVTNLEIRAKPTVPTITPPSQLVVCSPTNLTLTVSCASGNVVWSDNSTGTSLTLSAVGTYSISAKCTLNSCDSDQSSTTNLEIKAKPSIPTITPPSQLIVCSPSNLTLTANCASGNVIWSDNSTGTSLTLSAVGTYAISAKCTLNACDSDQSSVTNLEIKAKPSVPTITPPSQLVVCSPSNLTLTANCASGTVVWSDNSTGTSLTLSAVGTYAISAKCTLNGCDSDQSSVTNLEIKAKPSVPTITPPSQLVVCSPSNLTLTVSCASGNVVWSDNSTGTSLTLSAVGTYAISAKCTLNGCDSDQSSITNLEIKAKPSVPTITPPSQLVVCSPSNLALTANCASGNVVWSDNSTGTNLTLSAVGTYAISAKCTLNGCDSDQSSVTNLEIKAKPSVPTITPPSQLIVCSPSNLTLTASCATGNVVWSDNSTGTSLTLSVVGTYSISAKCVLNGCDSDQSSVTNLEIKAKPSVPTITPPSQLIVCSPSNLTLTANCSSGNVVWSNNSTGTSLTLSAVGTYSISAKCTLNGCDSDPSSITNLEIKALPNVTATNTGPYTVGQSVSLVGSGGGTYSWTGPNNFSSTLSSLSIPNALSVNGGIYTLTVVGVNGCSAAATTNVVVSGVDPCDPSRIVDYLYVKAGNPHQPLFNLTDGMIINQIPEQVSILVTPSLCPSVIIESFEMNIQGPELNWNIWQNVAPNALFDNAGTDIWGRSFKPGNYTLTVTGYAQDNKDGGITYGPKIIRFTVVGNLATINAPLLYKNTICAGSSVDVSFNTTGVFGISNEFRVELSDSSGSFGSPILIGTTNAVGTLSCTIPQNTVEGTKYLIRVASSNQVVVSNPAISQVAIHPYSHNLVSPTNNLTGTKTKKAVTNINASNKVASPASVTYQAGKSILLTPGFESGAVFKAEIQACEN